jgi:hypothetical protein
MTDNLPNDIGFGKYASVATAIIAVFTAATGAFTATGGGLAPIARNHPSSAWQRSSLQEWRWRLVSRAFLLGATQASQTD